jgi:hypothetical protein
MAATRIPCALRVSFLLPKLSISRQDEVGGTVFPVEFVPSLAVRLYRRFERNNDREVAGLLMRSIHFALSKGQVLTRRGG